MRWPMTPEGQWTKREQLNLEAKSRAYALASRKGFDHYNPRHVPAIQLEIVPQHRWPSGECVAIAMFEIPSERCVYFYP